MSTARDWSNKLERLDDQKKSLILNYGSSFTQEQHMTLVILYDKEKERVKRDGAEPNLVAEFQKILRSSFGTDDVDGFLQDDKQKWTGRVPSERALGRISQHFGEGWQMIGLELGLTEVRISQIMLENKNEIVTTITKMLIEWQRNNGRNATFKVLIDAINQCKGRATINLDALEKIYMEEQQNLF